MAPQWTKAHGKRVRINSCILAPLLGGQRSGQSAGQSVPVCQDAREAFEEELELHPNSGHALYGMEEC